ncbi:hypothetical protein [Cellulomonas alba]|uniref:Restriction endonuclease type II-like domain-containing protein n=1 Tax=Cellulomonas alba TaxID=3053467 RepID=A0ABT7SH75_9CELL|nr:hypothetical protein [Cellulomonas alba]MDM7855525.1 hypothetical protein [Cellulomonas alba]
MTVPVRTPGSGTDEAPDDDAPSTQDSGVVLVEPPSADELVEGAIATWRASLVEAAGGSTLADVELLGDAALDLSAAHPSGMAQLYAGRETRLSNLVREGGALSTARRRARAVSARAAVSAQRFGFAPTALAIGVATWTETIRPELAGDDVAALASVTRRAPARPSTAPDGTADDAADDAVGTPEAPAPRTVRAPVLLRPVTLRPRGSGESDYELALEPTLEVNPVLARALRSRGALLDPGAVARGTFASGGFDPQAALDRLASLGEAVLDDFTLTERVVVGAFVHPGQALVDDLDALAGTLDRHEVVAALAGVEEERERLLRPLPAPVTGDRDPGMERGVGDLDPAQQHVIDVVASGAHTFVDAPAGADVTGTVAAIVADAAASGRTVLYVPGHRRAAVELGRRLDRLGLGDLLLDVAPDTGWRAHASRRLLGAMTAEPPQIDVAGILALRESLAAHRERLAGYVDGLHAPRAPWGVSAYDALQQLARLTSARPTPRTTVRLTPEVARVLDEPRRSSLANDLVAAGELGAFSVRPSDTPWYGADLRTPADAEVVRLRLARLLDDSLPSLFARTAEVAAETGLVQATTLDAWRAQLDLLDGVRGALDAFLPVVFERTAADLVAATASPQWREQRGIEMGFWLRRRLRKQAHDMQRPGRPIADLHAGLLEVQRQREAWQAQCPSGGWPRLPEGLEHLEDEYAAVRLDLDALEEVLATTPSGGGLTAMPLTALVGRLTRLRADTDALDTLPARTGLVHRLRSAGLGALVDDLAQRRVDPKVAAAELDLAWWSTVFEQVLMTDPALAGYDGAALGELSRRYADLDRAHVASLAGPVRLAVAQHVSTALRRHREQAEALFGELVEERLTTLRDTFDRYPDVARRLRPVIVASPMLVPQVLPAARTVDLVVLDSAAHLPLEVALPALARGRQVVVVGDARCASGSALGSLSEVLPTVSVTADASRRDPYLTAFLGAHGYGDVLRATPLPVHRPLVRLDLVEGTGMPDRHTGVVEAPRDEVDHVLELVLDHALMRPDESLAVVTASPLHADAVREAVLSEVRGNPALAAFFDAGQPEPFVVTDLAGVAGLRREAVVLSLGLGRTPHRRVLHTFGPVSEPGGDALLLDALGATRHRLVVVSSFAAADLDPERLRGPGPRLLRDLLAFADRRGAGASGEELVASLVVDGPADARPADADARPADAGATDTDRLLIDLAERLWHHGLTVELDHGIPGGDRIPLVVGHPDVPGELLVAVLTDDAAYVDEPSVRVRDRLTADRLERLGWSVLRVWSAAAFLDPQAEVDRIRRSVHARVPAPAVPRSGPVELGVPEPVDANDEGDELPSAEADAGSSGAGEPADAGVALGTVPPSESTPSDDVPMAATDEPAASTPLEIPSDSAVVHGDDVAAEDGTTDALATAPGTASAGEPDAEPDADDATDAPAAAAEPGEPTATEAAPSERALQLVLPVPTSRRPDVRKGLPIGAYSDDQLDDLVAWLRSDGQDRSRDELASALRDELGITRRSHRVDTAVRSAISRALS